MLQAVPPPPTLTQHAHKWMAVINVLPTIILVIKLGLYHFFFGGGGGGGEGTTVSQVIDVVGKLLHYFCQLFCSGQFCGSLSGLVRLAM